jgi:hypothetical protein
VSAAFFVDLELYASIDRRLKERPFVCVGSGLTCRAPLDSLQKNDKSVVEKEERKKEKKKLLTWADPAE